MQIMDKVDILDQVKVNVFRAQPSPGDPAPLGVTIEALDKSKVVVFDESSLKVFNNKISELVIGRQLKMESADTFTYIQEFVGRMLTELHRNGLVELDDVPDGPDDPYKDVRSKF